jgi:hypothetical protein
MNKMIACMAIQALVAGASFAQPAIAPTPQSVAPQAPKTGLLDVKTALCQIDNLLTPIDGIPVPAGEAALCQPSYSIENLAKYISMTGIGMDYAALGVDLQSYFIFRAMAFSNVDQCSPLGPLSDALHKVAKTPESSEIRFEDSCRGHFDEIRLARAVITRDAELGAICQQTMKADGGAAAFCGQIAAHAGDLKAATASICESTPEKKRSKCVDLLGAMSGDAAACHLDHHERHSGSHKTLCLGIVAFSKAGPAKNPALCGDDLVCLAMSGSAVKGSVHAARLIAQDLSPVLFKEARQMLLLVAASADPLNAAAAKEIDAREDRIAALQLKLDPESRKPLKGTVKEADDAQEK